MVGGIFGDVEREKERRRQMAKQRNKEYNDLKTKVQIPQGVAEV